MDSTATVVLGVMFGLNIAVINAKLKLNSL
jgi:hypothetical protein